MTKKCFSCSKTKGLKAIMLDEDHRRSSVCKSCYFETCSCESDGHSTMECLGSVHCSNHELTKGLFLNWNNYNYHYKLKNLKPKEKNEIS